MQIWERPESLFVTPPIRVIDLPGVINDKYIYICSPSVNPHGLLRFRTGPARHPDAADAA